MHWIAMCIWNRPWTYSMDTTDSWMNVCERYRESKTKSGAKKMRETRQSDRYPLSIGASNLEQVDAIKWQGGARGARTINGLMMELRNKTRDNEHEQADAIIWP